jgi:hypothetical protein
MRLNPQPVCRDYLNERVGKGRQSLVIKNHRKTWYVSILVPGGEKTGHYSRRSASFATESEAKKFAAGKVADGAEVSAGTLNPIMPKRAIKSSEIEKWLSEKVNSSGD